MVSYSDIHVLMLSLTFLTILVRDYMGLCLIFIVYMHLIVLRDGLYIPSCGVPLMCCMAPAQSTISP